MRIAVVAVVAVAACGGPRWHQVWPAPAAVYRYDPPIEGYAPDDAGLWIVTARDASPAGRQRLTRLVDEPDDVSGDGVVVRLTGDRAAWLRDHPDVAAVIPLQPGDRVGGLGPATAAGTAGPIAVRIDLATGVSAGERDGVVAWLAGHGVTAVVTGPLTLDAELAPALARALATLGPVRWIERRPR